LGDLFNYFVIFFDRPFEIGDFIVVDDKKGTVEYIGIKTTRLKALSGEQLILSNSDLTKSRLHNFKRLQSRRIVFSFGIVYEVSPQQLREIPVLLKSIILEHSQTTFDRAHFVSYGSFSLNFEVVYFVENPEYNVYMDIQQNINIRIYEEFAKRNIEFAYPTQRVVSRDGAVEAQPNSPGKEDYGNTQ
jgi:small-conductance mechanosensitive channel